MGYDSTYNYRVVVNLEVNPNTRGANTGADYLQNIERQVMQSQKRITDYETQFARERYNQKVADYNRQLEQTRLNAQEEIALEIKKNQSIATERARYNRQRLADMRAAAQAEINIERAKTEQILALQVSQNNARSASLTTAARTSNAGQGTVTGGFTPSEIITQQQRINELIGTGRGNFGERTSASPSFTTSARGFLSPSNELPQLKKQIEDVDKVTKSSASSFGIWGQAFRGAFIGAIAGITFSTLVDAITKPIELLGELTVRAIQVGAEFEQTRNALIVFAGSASAADRELAALDATARNTAGLRLEPAREGYRQLRALGFEADNARNLIAGLGKERLLSGANEQDVQRVIVNLTQLSAGSNRASQDIKEIFHSMPSLRKEFALAFGTLDPQKIAKIFGKDPQEAIKKLTAEMERTKGASGGLSDAWGKLSDAWLTLETTFGTELLSETTSDVKLLTEAINKNKDAVKEWGAFTADILGGIRMQLELTAKGWEIYNNSFIKNQVNAGLTFGLSEYLPFLGNMTGVDTSKTTTLDYFTFGFDSAYGIGAMQKKYAELREAEKNKDKFTLTRNWGGTGTLSRAGFADVPIFSDNEFSPLKKREDEIRKMQQAEKARQDDLSKIDAYYSQTKNIRENAFNIEIAQNQANIEKIHQIKQKDFEQQRADAVDFYNRKIALSQDDEIEAEKLEIEKGNALRDIQTKQKVEEIEFQREKNRKKLETDKEFWQTNQDILEYNFQETQRITELNIQRGNITYKEGYDSLLKESDDFYAKLRQNINTNFDLELKQEGLNADEIININQKRALELAKIDSEQAKQTIEIEQKKRDAFLKTLEFQREMARQNYELISGISSRLQQDFFDPANFNSQSLENFRQFVLKRGERDRLQGERDKEAIRRTETINQMNSLVRVMKEANAQSDSIAEQMDKVLPGKEYDSLGAKWKEQQAIYDKASKEWDDLNGQLRQSNIIITNLEGDISKLGDSIPEQYELFDKLAEQIGTTAGAFDKLDKAILEHRQRLDSADAQAEIDYWQTVLDNTQDFDKQNEAKLRLQQAQNRKIRLDYDQNIEKANQYRHSIEGINREIELLLSRDPKKLGALKDVFDKQQGEDVISILEQNIMLEYKLASPNLTAPYKVRAEVLQHIIDLRNQETEAISRNINAQIDFNRQFQYSNARADASVMEFLASQKGITEILSDVRINAITTAYDGLDAVAQRLGKHFGIASKAVEDLISSLLKLGVNYVFKLLLGNNAGNLFGLGGMNGSSRNNGGFSFGNLITGGLSGSGSTGGLNFPNFNFGGFGNTHEAGNIFGLPPTGSTVRLADGTLATQVNADSGLLPQGSPLGGSTSAFGGTGLSGFGGLAQAAGFGLTGALLGAQLGRGSIGGSILGGLGGLSAGIIGTLGIGLATGSITGISAAIAASTIGILAPVAVAALVGAYFIGRSNARRRDEKIRNQAMVDALKQIDDLITGVKNDTIDGAQALTQAQQIREKYVQDMSQLKTKKTREIALKDVSRIDAKIGELQAAITNQTARRERLEQSVPTFAEGGSLSSFIAGNYRHNPLGYQTGGQSFGYFPSANRIASFNERGSEYILDAETTRAIGVNNLDMMRSTKGQSFKDMQRSVKFGGFASGGSASPVFNASNGSTGNTGTGNGALKVNNNIHVTLGMNTIIEAVIELVNEASGSKQNVTDITNFIKQDGGNELVDAVIKKAKARKLIN